MYYLEVTGNNYVIWSLSSPLYNIIILACECDLSQSLSLVEDLQIKIVF